MGPSNHVLDSAAHWHNLTNRTEPFACGGYAALCQITLTTCSMNKYNDDDDDDTQGRTARMRHA